MKNAIFIHAANMDQDVKGNYNIGRCQEIIDRIIFFINESNIIKDVDLVHLGYTGNKNLHINLDKSTINYYGENIYRWEFPTLHALQRYCKKNPTSNVLYLHTQGVSQGYNHPERRLIDQRRDYHLYWNITHYKEAILKLKTHDTCGAMLVPLNADLDTTSEKVSIKKLHDNPVWHYSQNFWWSTAAHINSLPDPENYPLILDERHQAEFWVCSSTNEGKHASLHDLYCSWCYASDFSLEKFMSPEHLNKFNLCYK